MFTEDERTALRQITLNLRSLATRLYQVSLIGTNNHTNDLTETMVDIRKTILEQEDEIRRIQVAAISRSRRN